MKSPPLLKYEPLAIVANPVASRRRMLLVEDSKKILTISFVTVERFPVAIRFPAEV
jgi:hypothetical protein